MSTGRGIRRPAVAGLFYPRERTELSAAIDELVTRAHAPAVAGKIVALVAPHAGYLYSGLTAATAYKLLRGKRFDAVAVVSPSHREYFDGISVYGGTAYRTPLGDIRVDEELRESLVSGEAAMFVSDVGHREEHALEVHLPFLQRIIGDFGLLPVVMGDQRREYCFALGTKLGLILKGRNVLLIASTDLSHYHPYDEAVVLDRVIVEHVGNFAYDELMSDLESKRAEACGGGPTVAVLLAAHELGATKVEVLHYCNSGDVTGDRRGVVGYLSAAILQPN